MGHSTRSIQWMFCSFHLFLFLFFIIQHNQVIVLQYADFTLPFCGIPKSYNNKKRLR